MGKKNDTKPTRPPAITVPSDDFEIEIDGETYQPHRGERVEVLRGVTVGDYKYMRAVDELSVKIDAVEGEADGEDDDAKLRQLIAERQQKIVLMDDSYGETVAFVRDRLVSWDWTDRRGEQLPQPGDDPDVFGRLSLEELFYLVSVIRGETGGQAKNASRPSQTSSSATAPRTSRT